MFCPAHSSWFDHLNNISQLVNPYILPPPETVSFGAVSLYAFSDRHVADSFKSFTVRALPCRKKMMGDGMYSPLCFLLQMQGFRSKRRVNHPVIPLLGTINDFGYRRGSYSLHDSISNPRWKQQLYALVKPRQKNTYKTYRIRQQYSAHTTHRLDVIYVQYHNLGAFLPAACHCKYGEF